MAEVGRNDPCPCKSGKKYKKCCEAKDQTKEHNVLEKQWTQAEKEFEKQKKEAEKAAAQNPAAPRKPGAPPPQVKEQRHSTIPAPKFNMPRRIGGG